MNDDELIARLRSAAKRAATTTTTTTNEQALAEPLGDAFEARLTAEILSSQRSGTEKHTTPALPVIVLPPRRARRPAFAWIGGLAAAACLALALTRVLATPSGAPLDDMPLYALAVTGGQDTSRGPDDLARGGVSVVVAPADAPLTVSLRPPTDVSGPLAVRLFTVRGAVVTEAHGVVRAAPSGAVEIGGAMRDLAGVGPGDATLVIVIAHEAAHVDARALVVAAPAAGAQPPATAGASITRVALRVVP